MSNYRIEVDDHVADTLLAHPESIELVDAEGRVLGTFTPALDVRRAIYEQLVADVDDVECSAERPAADG
jgi:hypothetical protein